MPRNAGINKGIRDRFKELGIKDEVAGILVKEIFNIIFEELKRTGQVRIPGFGVFDVYRKRFAPMRDYQTLEVRPEFFGTCMRFKPSKRCKDYFRNVCVSQKQLNGEEDVD